MNKQTPHSLGCIIKGMTRTSSHKLHCLQQRDGFSYNSQSPKSRVQVWAGPWAPPSGGSRKGSLLPPPVKPFPLSRGPHWTDYSCWPRDTHTPGLGTSPLGPTPQAGVLLAPSTPAPPLHSVQAPGLSVAMAGWPHSTLAASRWPLQAFKPGQTV